MALIGAVNKYGHPLRAAVVFAVLTAVAGAFGMFGGVPMSAIALRTAIAFVAAAVVFWLVDRVEGLFLGTVVTILGASTLIVLGWLV